jgi:hypothetical protein
MIERTLIPLIAHLAFACWRYDPCCAGLEMSGVDAETFQLRPGRQVRPGSTAWSHSVHQLAGTVS